LSTQIRDFLIYLKFWGVHFLFLEKKRGFLIVFMLLHSFIKLYFIFACVSFAQINLQLFLSSFVFCQFLYTRHKQKSSRFFPDCILLVYET